MVAIQLGEYSMLNKKIFSLWVLCVTAQLISMMQTVQAMPIASISELQWQHRVIVIFSDAVSANTSQLETNQHAINDRDIVWFVISENQIETNFNKPYSDKLIKNITNTLGGVRPAVLLIGKDGGIKSRSDTLNLSILFSLIDSMPMRQAEMRRNNSQ